MGPHKLWNLPRYPGDGVDFGEQPLGCGRRLERWQDAVHQGASEKRRCRGITQNAEQMGSGWAVCVCVFVFFFWWVGGGLREPLDVCFKIKIGSGRYRGFKTLILGSIILKWNKSLKFKVTFDVCLNLGMVSTQVRIELSWYVAATLFHYSRRTWKICSHSRPLPSYMQVIYIFFEFISSICIHLYHPWN